GLHQARQEPGRARDVGGELSGYLRREFLLECCDGVVHLRLGIQWYEYLHRVFVFRGDRGAYLAGDLGELSEASSDFRQLLDLVIGEFVIGGDDDDSGDRFLSEEI